jgi:hypothetical protein
MAVEASHRVLLASARRGPFALAPSTLTCSGVTPKIVPREEIVHGNDWPFEREDHLKGGSRRSEGVPDPDGMK